MGRFGELGDEGIIGVEHREITVGLLALHRVVRQLVTRTDDQIHQLFAVGRLGVFPQGVFQCHDRRLVLADLVVGIGVQELLVVEPPRQLVTHLLELPVLLAVGITRHELRNGDDRLAGDRLVALGRRREVVEAHGVHPFGIFDERTAAEGAAVGVEQLRGRVVTAVLEMGAGDVERKRVGLAGSRVVVFDVLQKRDGLAPFSGIVQLDALGVDRFGIASLDEAVDAAAPAQGGAQSHDAEQVE